MRGSYKGKKDKRVFSVYVFDAGRTRVGCFVEGH